MSVVGRLVSPLLGRRRMQWFFEGCFELSVRGMNLDGPSDHAANGERALVTRLAAKPSDDSERWTVLDVGANIGDWTLMTSHVLASAGRTHDIWAFEPAADSYAQLSARTAPFPSVRPQKIALGAEEGRAVLHSAEPASALASLYTRREVSLDRSSEVEITTLDRFRQRHGIGRVHLLKLDVEGHELAVLSGARETLAEGEIDVLQFEFGGTHIDSRTFVHDLYDALGPDFDVYRVLRDGLRPLGPWSAKHEIFRLGNYVALRRVRWPSL